jgi:glycosyltransferase involved in cell wall biosynthesis
MMPRVSIITVCLNCRRDIETTLSSIFQQSYDNVERIVVDGFSSDGTKEYLESLKDKLAVFISEPDQGIYDAMNKGINSATGDYLIFINAGDRFAHKDVLSNVMQDPNVIERRPTIISGRVQFEINNELLNLFRPSRPGKEGKGLPHQATFIDAALQKENLFDTRFRFVGDYELWRRLQKNDLFHVYYSNEVVAVFSLGGVSNATGNDPKRYLERAYVDYLYSNIFTVFDALLLFLKILMRRTVSSIFGGKIFVKILRFRKTKER